MSACTKQWNGHVGCQSNRVRRSSLQAGELSTSVAFARKLQGRAVVSWAHHVTPGGHVDTIVTFVLLLVSTKSAAFSLLSLLFIIRNNLPRKNTLRVDSYLRLADFDGPLLAPDVQGRTQDGVRAITDDAFAPARYFASERTRPKRRTKGGIDNALSQSTKNN